MRIKKACGIASIVLGVITVILVFVMKAKIDSLTHEHINEDFAKDTKYAQITLLIPESAEFTVDKLMYFRYNVETKLAEKSYVPKDGARLYVDAYFAYKDISLSSDTSRTSSAKAIYVGGDYKFFRKNLEYMPDVTKDINHDRILLSRTNAWRLYGGENLYDFRVSDGTKDYFVSGVFEDEKDAEFTEFYKENSPCVIDYAVDESLPITCYEIIIINPVKKFAMDIIKESIDLPEGSFLLIENSERFKFTNLFKNIGKIVKIDENLPTGVFLTPYEVKARTAEKQLALILLITLITAAIPALVILFLIYKLIKLIKNMLDKLVFSKIRDKLSYS